MIKKLYVFLLIFAISAPSLFAAEVYVTKRAKFYHLATCKEIQNKQKSVLDEKLAESRRLRPCPVCFKDTK